MQELLQQHAEGEGEDELSLHELRDRLRTSFRETGVLADITARLRRQFVAELVQHHHGPPAMKALVANRQISELPLTQRQLRNLVADFLRAQGLLQSLAVFLPESG
ncbi:hypothetical protein JKP88DRAFT_162331, partial [Tribonema minus]